MCTFMAKHQYFSMRNYWHQQTSAILGTRMYIFWKCLCYSTFCPYVSPADVSQMGRGNSPTFPNSKTRPRKFTCNSIKPSTSNMCYKDYFWRGWKLCSLYKFIFYFINEAKNIAFASNCLGKFNNIENILALLKSLDF